MRPRIAVSIAAAALAVAVPASASADPPANDESSDATQIDGVPYAAGGDTSEATAEVAEPQGSGCGGNYGRTLWYRYTAPADQRLLVAVDAGRQMPVAVFEGPHPLRYEQCGAGGRTIVRAQGGTTYYFQIGEFGEASGPFTLNVVLDGGIAGRVTFPGGDPPGIANVFVRVYRASNDTSYRSACAEGDGQYLIEGLEAGTYKVRFGFGCEDEPDRAPHEWYDDVPRATCAAVISVRAGADTTGIDAALDRREGASKTCSSRRTSRVASPPRVVPPPLATTEESSPERSDKDQAVGRYDGEARVDLGGGSPSRSREFALASSVAALVLLGVVLSVWRARGSPVPEDAPDAGAPAVGEQGQSDDEDTADTVDA